VTRPPVLRLSPGEWAAWCDEEYRRMAAWPPAAKGPESRDQLTREGSMAMLAQLGAALRSGRPPQHCPCRQEWLDRQAKGAGYCARPKGSRRSPRRSCASRSPNCSH
jgi:hypothetical protein